MALIDEFSEWNARLVEIPKDHRVLLRCPVRCRDFVDGPEERIRQALLHYFVELSNEVSFVLGAERERHDIDLCWPPDDDFRPATPPLLIVETKVDGVAGDWTNQQVARYLAETAGDCGIVFTGFRMWTLDLTPTGPRSVALPSLSDLAALVRERAALDPLGVPRIQFQAARTGDLEALRALASRFRYSTFVLSISGRDTPCRNLRFIGETIEYRPADRHVRKPSCVARADLMRLVRIVS